MASGPLVPPTLTEPAPEDQLTVNLHVVSPSVGVNRPIIFPGLSALTTLQQLKDRIRQSLPSRPPDEYQRLIHRGRVLQRDQDTLLDVFGAETLRSTDQQTVHLVVRDPTDAHHSGIPTPVRGQSPAPGMTNPGQDGHGHQHQQHRHQHFAPQQSPSGFPRRGHLHHGLQPTSNPFPAGTQGFFPANVQNPGALTPQQLHQVQATQHQAMTQWINNLQRDALNRAIINQQQRDRAAMGMHGAGGDSGANAPGTNTPEHLRGRVSPGVQQQDMHTVVREGIGPNGQHYRVMVNETHYPLASQPQANPNAGAGNGVLSAADVQNMLRGADAGQATLTMTNAMHRSASGTSLTNGPTQPVGVTTSYYPFPHPASRAGSGRATPDPASRTPSGGSSNVSAPARPSPSAVPEVYILNSPHGPRALLFNGSSEAYYTPPARMPAMQSFPFARNVVRQRQVPVNPLVHGERAGAVQPQPTPTLQQPAAQQEQERQRVAQPPAQAPPAAGVHPNNPGIGPIVAQVWPHFWLIIRLAAFVWWFTTPDSSWSRWVTVIGIAIAIFILNTNLLNGVADQAWRPIRQHMENLIPLGDRPHQGPRPDNQPAEVRNREQQNRNPDPAETAARLVVNRRNANANWLMGIMRQVERAGLLFLASIAPGIAERHIENLEAEAERTRREAEAAAAAAAAERERETGPADQSITEEGGGENGGANDARPEQGRDVAQGPENELAEEVIIF